MVDLDRYRDNDVLTTSEAAEWLYPDLRPSSARRMVVSLGAEPLKMRGREYRWLVADLRRRVLGLPPVDRAAQSTTTRVLQMKVSQ